MSCELRKICGSLAALYLFSFLANNRQKALPGLGGFNEIFLNPADSNCSVVWCGVTQTHQAVKALVAPGYGGLPGPDRGSVPQAEVVPLQGLVQTVQQEVALQLEVIRKGPEGLPGPGSCL